MEIEVEKILKNMINMRLKERKYYMEFKLITVTIQIFYYLLY
jgi:hypothetical protein